MTKVNVIAELTDVTHDGGVFKTTTQHTPTPNTLTMLPADELSVRLSNKLADEFTPEYLAFIVRAVNSHDALTDKLESLSNIALLICSRHHAGNPVSNTLWSDLNWYANEARAALAKAKES